MSRWAGQTRESLFKGLLGLAGWTLLVTFTVREGWPEPRGGLPLFGAFLLFVAMARFLGFRSYRGLTVSLDTAFYVAGMFAMGALPTGWAAGITLLGHRVYRWVEREVVDGEERPPLSVDLAGLVFASGTTGALFPLLSAGLGLDRLLEVGPVGLQWELTWLLPLVTLLFLVIHYGLSGLAYLVGGAPAGEVLRGLVVPGVVMELPVLPLPLSMALVFDPERPVLFVLLGVTFLLGSFVVQRLMDARESLEQRVRELATLNEVGQAIASVLDKEDLVRRIARETLRMLDNSSHFMLGLVVHDPETEEPVQVRLEVYDRNGARFEEAPVPYGEGLTGRVMRERQVVNLGDLQRQLHRLSLPDEYNDPRIHAYLGVPLVVFDDVIGIISVQSERAFAYSEDHVRVITTIARQAAVALKNAHLYELATVDWLTGLYVRRYFDQRLRDEWQRARRHELEFSVALMDLDDFKAVNDEHGHAVGDRVLRLVGRVIRAGLREIDIAARYGGEEFAFILPRTGRADAVRVAERVRGDLEGLAATAAGEVVGVTASFGVAGGPAGTFPDLEALVRAADEALYRAKDRGKNRVEAAGGEGQRGAAAR